MIHYFRQFGISLVLLLGLIFTPLLGVAQGKNLIEAVSVVKQGNDLVLKVDLSAPLNNVPTGFSIANPPRVAFDFTDVDNGLSETSKVFKEGDLTSVNVIRAGNRTRLVLNLVRSHNFTTRLEGSSLLVALVPVDAAAGTAPAATRFSRETPVPVSGITHSIQDIAFRRGDEGEARIIVALSDPDVAANVRRQGRVLAVDFQDVTLPENLRRRLDVRDFATPVSTVVTDDKGGKVRMEITPHGQWEYNAYQTENQLIVEVKKIVEDPNKLVQGSTPGYQGPRISINYQNGDVRTLLRLMAEELGLNAVISETVVGSTTLVLKDVPADQVIAIILKQKGLDMRKNDNVILFAPRDELATRERLEFEALQQMNELEPLRTENFQLNYHTTSAVKAILTSEGGAGILSKRGSVREDPRSNILFVQDIPSRLEDVRRLLAQIDVSLRQVVIEARIVEASEDFGRNIGVRLGLLHGKNYTDGGAWFGTAGSDTETLKLFNGEHSSSSNWRNPAGGVEGQATFPGLNQVNLPAAAYGGTSPQLFSFLLANRQGTRLLNLEISALEADNKGRIVSSPRILTSDKNKAMIKQGVQIPYQESGENGGTTVSFKDAVLQLDVTPHITPDGKVSMQLDIRKDSRGETLPGGVAIDTKQVTTNVLVDNGGTIVIGGIYELAERNDTSKVPLLGDLPLLGHAFRNNSRINEKSELLVFITPRIVDESLSVR
ncbi:MAG: type IV pilus secretin PilQ [Zoogloeaceae bacterium]|jgi:type IV pilus assembly protein PilQ|nr:type IV pilus secretin PilQ [Zoogloeaceae bacterium]